MEIFFFMLFLFNKVARLQVLVLVEIVAHYQNRVDPVIKSDSYNLDRDIEKYLGSFRVRHLIEVQVRSPLPHVFRLNHKV